MNILIIEDELEKRREIAETLLSVDGISDENITYASDVYSAKREIKRIKFDLVILDINLPYRPDSRTEVGAGLSVLSFIKQNNKAKRPSYLFGLTAHDDGAEIAEKEFSSPLWKLVRFSYGEVGWKAPLKEAVSYLKDSLVPPFQNDGISFHVDLGIFVALEGEELASILALDGGWTPVTVQHDHARYFQGSFNGPSGKISVVVTAAPKMGMPAAGVVASKLINSFRPRVLAITGICAGVRGKTNLGDILIADPCFDWGSGKWIKNKETGQRKFIPAAYQWRLDESLRSSARTLADDPVVLSEIHKKFHGTGKPKDPPKVHIDAMASGASVLQASASIDEIREHHKNLIGIEMESYAVFTAAEYSPEPRPMCVSIKSVCDFADEEKSDAVHEYAAHTSAHFLYELAVRNFVEDEH